MTRRTDDLIAQLSADAGPVRRIASPATRLALWAVVLAVGTVLTVAEAWQGNRCVHLLEPSNLSIFLLNLLAIPFAAYSALQSAVPGSPRRGIGYRVALITAIAIAAPLVIRILAAHWSGHATELGAALACAKVAAQKGAIPAAVLVLLLRRAHPLDPTRSGLLALLAAGLAGMALLHLHCPDGDPLHLLVGHWGAMAGIASLGLAGGWLLRHVGKGSKPD
jgi:hypothetical protein